MQIHEITQHNDTLLAEVTLPSEWLGQKAKGAASSVASGIKNFGGAVADTARDIGSVAQGGKDAFRQAGQERKIQQTTDKAYSTWTNYADQLEKSVDPADRVAFDNRTDGYYEKALLAFVNKNLLGGMYLPNVANKDQILKIVKQLSAPKISPPTGGAGAIGQMANQLSAGPAVGTQKTTSTGGTTTTTPTGTVHTAKASAPPATTTPATKIPYGTPPAAGAPTAVKGANKPGAPTPAEQAKLQQKIAAASKKTMNEALDAATEKQLFAQLVRASAVAQTTAPGVGQPGTQSSTSQSTSNTQGQSASGNQDAQGMAQTLRQQLDPAIAKGLPALGITAKKLTGTNQVKSTGNPGADGLLILMGFQGL
jgi:hypothetical protein